MALIQGDISKNKQDIAAVSTTASSNTNQISNMTEHVKSHKKFVDDQAEINRDLVNELNGCKKEMTIIKEKQNKVEKERRKLNFIIHSIPENKDKHP